MFLCTQRHQTRVSGLWLFERKTVSDADNCETGVKVMTFETLRSERCFDWTGEPLRLRPSDSCGCVVNHERWCTFCMRIIRKPATSARARHGRVSQAGIPAYPKSRSLV